MTKGNFKTPVKLSRLSLQVSFSRLRVKLDGVKALRGLALAGKRLASSGNDFGKKINKKDCIIFPPCFR